MFIQKQPARVIRQYPANLSQQRDVLRYRNVMKNTTGERNIEDTGF